MKHLRNLDILIIHGSASLVLFRDFKFMKIFLKEQKLSLCDSTIPSLSVNVSISMFVWNKQKACLENCPLYILPTPLTN